MSAACIGQSRSLRVFVVENHPDTLAVFSLYLISLGHTVTNAHSLTEACALWPQASYDLLTVDIHLPDGEGWALLEGLLSPRPRYAIVVSALGYPKDCARSEAAGFRHHLLKPFKVAELDEILAEATREATTHDLLQTRPKAA